MHYDKFKQSALGAMFRHYERAKNSNDECIASSRHTHIDETRTHLNYNLGPARKISQYEFLQERLKNVYVRGRDGALKNEIVKMCDWIITLPCDVKNGDEKKFFECVYQFFEEKYKRENVISAYVHNDEKTPHLHFSFIPVVEDKKRGEKLSAKACVKRSDLQKMHADVETFVSSKMGYNIQMFNVSANDDPSHVKKNKSIAELKLETEKQRIIDEAQNEAIRIISDTKMSSGIKIINNVNDRYRELMRFKAKLLEKTSVLNQYIIDGRDLNEMFNLFGGMIANDKEILSFKSSISELKHRVRVLENENKKIHDNLEKSEQMSESRWSKLIDIQMLVKRCLRIDVENLEKLDRDFLDKLSHMINSQWNKQFNIHKRENSYSRGGGR